MDLALEFGMPVSKLTGILKESELKRWALYARRYGLPTRRLQVQMAQIALTIARVNGNGDATLQDFLNDPVEPLKPEQNLALAKQAFGFNPRHKKGE